MAEDANLSFSSVDEAARWIVFGVMPFLDCDSVKDWKSLLYRLACHAYIHTDETTSSDQTGEDSMQVDPSGGGAGAVIVTLEQVKSSILLNLDKVRLRQNHLDENLWDTCLFPFDAAVQAMPGTSGWTPHMSHVSLGCIHTIRRIMQAVLVLLDAFVVPLDRLRLEDTSEWNKILYNSLTWGLNFIKLGLPFGTGESLDASGGWKNLITLAGAYRSSIGQRQQQQPESRHAVIHSELTNDFESVSLSNSSHVPRQKEAVLPVFRDLPWIPLKHPKETFELQQLGCQAFKTVFETWVLKNKPPYKWIQENASVVLNTFPDPRTLIIGTEFGLHLNFDHVKMRRTALKHLGSIARAWLGIPTGSGDSMPDLEKGTYSFGSTYAVRALSFRSAATSEVDSSSGEVVIHTRHAKRQPTAVDASVTPVWIPKCVGVLLDNIIELKNKQRMFVTKFLASAFGQNGQSWSTTLAFLLDHLAAAGCFNPAKYNALRQNNRDPKKKWHVMSSNYARDRQWTEATRTEYSYGCQTIVQAAYAGKKFRLPNGQKAEEDSPKCPWSNLIMDNGIDVDDVEELLLRSKHLCSIETGISPKHWSGPLYHWLKMAELEAPVPGLPGQNAYVAGQ